MFTHDIQKCELDNFGLEHLNIHEASALIAKCLLCNGELNITYDGDFISLFDSKLDELLKEHIARFSSLLMAAITEGTLKPARIQRNLDESIVSDQTYIKSERLLEWLNERGIELGDLYEDYLDFQSDVFLQVSKTIESEYAKK